MQKQRGACWVQGCCGEQGLTPSCSLNMSCPCWDPESLWPSCLHRDPRAIKESMWAQNCSLLLKMHQAESSHFCQMRKAQRDGEHSCLWLVMQNLRSQWPGESMLTQKPLCTCCWSEGIPGWEPPLLGEHYCSQTNINQPCSPAQCPTVPEKGAYRERPFSVQGTAQPGRHAGSHWDAVWGPHFCLFKRLVKELALPSGLFVG